MVNLLIIGNDISITKELLNNISCADLLSCDMSHKSEISKFLHIKESDILFLSKEVINHYNKTTLRECKNKLIYLAFDETQALSDKSIAGINNLAEIQINEKRKRIMEELKKIGYNFKYKGTQYLLETILEVQKGDVIALTSLQDNFYPIVAKKYNKTVHNIKNCIIAANNAMYYECNIENLKEYFHLVDDEKPSIKTVVYTIANKLF